MLNVYYMYKTEWILEGSYNCCLNFALHYNSNYGIGILPMVFWPPYPWYCDPPNHGISTPVPMVFWPPYQWDIEPPTHGISTPPPMVYPWYFDPPTHDILTSLHIFWLEMGGFKIPWGGSKYHGGSIYHTGGFSFQ
jgi:hypothetical protein